MACALFAAAILAGCATQAPQKSSLAVAMAPPPPPVPGPSLAPDGSGPLPDMVAVVPYAADAPPPALAAADRLAAPATIAAAPAVTAASTTGEKTDVAALEPVATAYGSAEPAPVQAATFIALPDTGPLPPPQPIAFVRTADPSAMLAPSAGAAAAPRSAVDGLIDKYASLYEVPVELVRRVVKRESNFNPHARNRVYWGLMQIRRDTAAGMGYRGDANGLLDPETNLKYAVKYLRGAYLVAGGNHDRADKLYQTGYYYDAKRMGLLEETGLRAPRLSTSLAMPVN